MRRWVVRKIRHGRVKINGRWFVPKQYAHDAIPYDGRLDGMRYLFALYPYLPTLANLHSEARLMGKSVEEIEAAWPGPECVDGKFSWCFWEAV